MSSAPTRVDVIAYVGESPINRSQLVDLLIAGHGVGLLEQLIALEQVRAESRRQGVTVTDDDIRAEADLALARLLSPIPPADPDAPLDRETAERLLDEVLAQRNVSRDEYMLVVERNAHLRALVNANTKVTQRELREEQQRAYRPTAYLRHIQVRNESQAEQVRSLLASGADASAVARDMSVNRRTALDGGRIKPFTRDDDAIPQPIRDAAFAMKPGEVSLPIRDGQWIHVLKLDRLETPPPASLGSERKKLEDRLRRRRIDSEMHTLFRTLFDRSDIRIIDPVLAREFQRKHPDRQVQSP